MVRVDDIGSRSRILWERRGRMNECRNLILGGISFVLVLNLFLFPVFHDEHAESDTFDDYKRCVRNGRACRGDAFIVIITCSRASPSDVQGN
jgi:hypothetical protein